MKELLGQVLALELMAKEVHYSYRGADFFGVHKLMDEVFSGLSDFRDEISETVFMGQGARVPTAIEVIDEASEFITVDVSMRSIVDLLDVILNKLSDGNIRVGEEKVLDDISAHCRKYRGLILAQMGVSG